MGDQGKSNGGVQFGNVGGNVNVQGNIAGRDVNVATNQTPVGFQQESHKSEFLDQLGELRSALNDIKSQIAGIKQLDAAAKEDLELEILQLRKELENTQNAAGELEAGKSPPEGIIESVTQGLEKTGGLLDRIKGLGESVAPLLTRALPLLASARHLIGLP
jgi:regulator of replication initiation timing